MPCAAGVDMQLLEFREITKCEIVNCFCCLDVPLLCWTQGAVTALNIYRLGCLLFSIQLTRLDCVVWVQNNRTSTQHTIV